MGWIRNSEIEALRKEIKGFYDGARNVDNEYLKQVMEFSNARLQLVDFSEANRDELVRYYKRNGIIRGIIDTTIASAVGELSDYIELVDKDNKVVNHWSMEVLNKPNDLYNKRKFIKAWAINRLITGDAFVYGLEGVGLNKEQFKELFLIPSHEVEILTGDILKPIRGYKLKSNASFDAKMTPQNTMFSRDYNPTSNSYYGLSKLYSAAYMVQLLEKADKRQNTSLDNGGVNALITPRADATGTVTVMQRDQIREELNRKGRSNYNGFLPDPVDIHKLGDTPVDLGILEASHYAINALCFAYGISVDTFLAQSKYENAKEAKKQIYEMAAIPLINEFLEDYTSFCKLKGMRFILNTDKIEILRNPKEQLEIMAAAHCTLNEKREYLGYERIEEPYADKPIIPMGVSFGDPNQYDINETEI